MSLRPGSPASLAGGGSDLLSGQLVRYSHEDADGELVHQSPKGGGVPGVVRRAPLQPGYAKHAQPLRERGLDQGRIRRNVYGESVQTWKPVHLRRLLHVLRTLRRERVRRGRYLV